MTKKKIRNAFLLSGICHCDLWFACSEEAGKALYGKKTTKNEKFFVIRNAVDGSRFAVGDDVRNEYRKEWDWENEKILLNVGRLTEQKNQEFLLDVLDCLVKKDSSYRLILVGEGNLKERMQDKTMALGLTDHVKFLGNRTDIPQILNAADLFVLPSLTEGLGIVLIEAQAAGLPCFASTGVPTDACITPHFTFLPLSIGAQNWADAIEKTENVRFNPSPYWEQSGYEISQCARKLADLYKTDGG